MTATVKARSVALLYEMAHALAAEYESHPCVRLQREMSVAFAAAQRAQRELFRSR